MDAHVVLGLADRAALVAHATHTVAAHARRAVTERGRFLLALSGGATPRPVYEALAVTEGFPWAETTLVYGDERCVPAGDPRSNHRMVTQALLSHLDAGAGPTVLPMPGHLPDADAAARRYDADLRGLAAGAPPVLDLVLLGIGTDGHTASLFPNSPLLDSVSADQALDEDARLVAASWSAETQTRRLTLMPRLLRAARTRLFLVVGDAKADVVARAISAGTSLPAGRVGPATWLVAPVAAFPGATPAAVSN